MRSRRRRPLRDVVAINGDVIVVFDIPFVDPSETDISKGGLAETQEYTLLKFWCEERKFFLVAATLRPETVYGQVCFWARPDIDYSIVEKDGETWVVAPQAAEKLQLQFDNVKTVGSIPGKELIGLMCRAPMLHKLIPVFPADFVDPNIGTGLVTSVPSPGLSATSEAAPGLWRQLVPAVR